ncbi:uncharacterized protein LOC120271835 [Dioscorea cayenensis subsp. rotundata]|uniref:Uncharacterized protein LOC120271835 n=1 Tax=Dioscorea cayennensis subsp. rotundata TaxID=55577 RepID=A0AB40C3U3_DIOCR|nr:uncharacterized protein LOC120271835 [Dioscorea cayenensis subsp. rotundata]
MATTTSTTDPSSDEPRNTWVLTSGIDSDAVATARQWLEDAAGQAIVLKQDLLAAARTAGRRILAASSSGFHETKEAVEWIKMEYAAREDELFSKIKEGVAIAAAHPNLSAGVTVSLGLVAFKAPRRFLIHNTRRLFVSEEFLLSQAEAKVNQLRQSVNSVKNDIKKFEERASNAQNEMERGRQTLIDTGSKIHRELRYIDKLEREAMGLKEFISELPRREASEYRSQVSGVISKVKEDKKVLRQVISKMVNYGISV